MGLELEGRLDALKKETASLKMKVEVSELNQWQTGRINMIPTSQITSRMDSDPSDWTRRMPSRELGVTSFYKENNNARKLKAHNQVRVDTLGWSGMCWPWDCDVVANSQSKYLWAWWAYSIMRSVILDSSVQYCTETWRDCMYLQLHVLN